MSSFRNIGKRRKASKSASDASVAVEAKATGKNAPHVDLRKLRRIDLLELLADKIRETESQAKTIEELNDLTGYLQAKVDEEAAQIAHLRYRLDLKDVLIARLAASADQADVESISAADLIRAGVTFGIPDFEQYAHETASASAYKPASESVYMPAFAQADAPEDSAYEFDSAHRPVQASAYQPKSEPAWGSVLESDPASEPEPDFEPEPGFEPEPQRAHALVPEDLPELKIEPEPAAVSPKPSGRNLSQKIPRITVAPAAKPPVIKPPVVTPTAEDPATELEPPRLVDYLPEIMNPGFAATVPIDRMQLQHDGADSGPEQEG